MHQHVQTIRFCSASPKLIYTAIEYDRLLCANRLNLQKAVCWTAGSNLWSTVLKPVMTTTTWKWC